MVFNSTFAEIISLAQGLVDDEYQSEEHTEAYRPFLIAGCVFVARPHHTTPGLENLYDALSLDFEECKFDLSLDTSSSRPLRVLCIEIFLYFIYGFVVEDEASFEDRRGNVNFERLSEEFALEQSVLIIS